MMANIVVIPMTGWFQRRFGYARYFATSVLVFTAASALCGLAWNLPTLVVFRVLQGMGGGAIIPTAQAILFQRYPREQHGTASAMFGLGAITGPLLGPTIGGYLIQWSSWHWIFLVNVPIGILVAFVIPRVIREPDFKPDTRPIDLSGIALLAIGMASLQYVLVVVEGNAAQHRSRLAKLHEEFFSPDKSDPLAPVRLEVLDRATDEALQQLITAGLVQPATRARRLLATGTEVPNPPALSPEERAKAGALRALAVRKLKMARLVGEGGLGEETRSPLLDAALCLGRAMAVEQRLPEPAGADEALLAPLSHCWGEALSELRSFTSDPAYPWQPVVESLEKELANPNGAGGGSRTRMGF
jgi:branched-subunit amino acid transport protein